MRHHRWHLCLWVLLALPAAWPAQSAEKSSILQDEPGLGKPITVSAYRIYLGELLERVSRQTGVRLEADDRQLPLSGYQLAMVTREKPAWQVLEAVRRLYSFPPDRWYWSKERDGRYVLHSTLSAAQLKSLREERRGELLVSLRRRMLEANAPRTGAASFIGAISEAEFRSILGGNALTFPADRLSAPQRAFLGNAFESLNRAQLKAPDVVAGQRQPELLRLDDVREVTIRRDDQMLSGIPAVVVQAGTVRSSLLGGFTTLRSQSDVLHSPWLQTDETVTAPDPPDQSPPASPTLPAAPGGPGNSIDRMLERLGHSTGIDLIYDRPVGKSAAFNLYFGGALKAPLPELLDRLGHQHLIWKQWEHIVLLRLADWESNPRDLLVPWNTIRQLRAQVDAEGNPTLDRYLLMAFLSPEQRSDLRAEFSFPAMGQRDEELLRVLQFAAGTTAQERESMAERLGAGWAAWSPDTRQRAASVLGNPHLQVHLKLTAQDHHGALEYWLAPEGNVIPTHQATIFPPHPDSGTQYPPALDR